MGPAAEVLSELGIDHEVHGDVGAPQPAAGSPSSPPAPATPGISVIICGAGKAAHLAGAVAANTTLPVIGVPIAAGGLGGLDALLATVQMPTGVPVATVAVDGAANAAYLAAVDHRHHRPGGRRPAGRVPERLVIERYTLPEMAAVWSEARKLAVWKEVETLVLEAWVDQGVAPEAAAAALRPAPEVDPAAWKAREEETRHDLAAFVDVLAASVDTGGEWVHYGLTSSDVLDTAQGVLMAEAVDLLLARLRRPVRDGPRPGGRACRHRDGGPHPRHLGGADQLRAQAGDLGVRDRPQPRSPAAGPCRRRRRQDLRRRRDLCPHPAGDRGDGVRPPRDRLRAGVVAGHPPRSPRRAAVDAGLDRVVAGAVRHRDPPPAAERGG